MTPEIDESTEAGISRRRMLKRVGAGMAIAWTAPVLTSLRTPAFAASPTCAAPCTDCACLGSSAVCGSDVGGDCVCSKDVDGQCACVSGRCAADGCTLPCTSNTQCQADEVCMTHCGINNCAVANCLKRCGAPAGKAARSGRPLTRTA
jgi:hypothetical protein